MTPDITEEGEDLTPPKRSRWYWALAQLPGFRGEQPPEVPDALVEAAQMESAFFASYMHEKSAFVTFGKRRQRIFWHARNKLGLEGIVAKRAGRSTKGGQSGARKRSYSLPDQCHKFFTPASIA